MLSRLKFDLSEIIKEKLSYIPNYIWESTTTTFCDFQMAGGQYIREIVNKLREFGHSDKNIKSRVYGYSENEFYLSVIQSDSSLIGTFDVYKKNINMKFDVIVGNYPYQENNGAATNKPIWDKFVDMSFKLSKDGGYIAVIHPPGWRNVGGKFKEVQKLLSSKNIIFLNVNSVDEGRKVFGATTPFDYYVCKNESYKGNTIISTDDKNLINHNIQKFNFVPSSNIDLFEKLISNSNTVQVLYTTEYHTQHSHVNDSKSNKFKYPLVRYAYRDNTIDFRYSNVKKGHFGIPKVIVGNGADSGNILVDKAGEYGMTEYAFAIVDDVNNLHNIKNALESEKFKNLMDSCRFGRTMYNRRVISSFRKDFWKEFIND